LKFPGGYCWDIPNGYTSDVVLNQQARVAHEGGMADCLPDGPVAGKPMADTGRRSLWRIRRQAHGALPCSTLIIYGQSYSETSNLIIVTEHLLPYSEL
jgi:hypothetical protein